MTYLNIGLLFGLLLPLASLAQIVVVDDSGVTHRFNEPAKRVVSLIPHATELLFEVGAGSQIVGAVEYSDYPAAAKEIPRVGNYSSINMEIILMLKPDLVIASPTNNHSLSLKKIKQLDTAVYISNPKTFKDIARNLENLGKLTGHAKQGKTAGESLYKKSEKLRFENAKKPKITVFYQVWDEPLMTLNGNSFISKSIELCGGRNVFADLLTVSAQISLESVISTNPQAIVTGGHDKSRQQWLQKWQRIKGIDAVEHGNVFQIPPDILQRPTSRLYEGTYLLCQALDKARKNLEAKQ